mmetsp:Transcript_6644/g.11735  ORF Transcript_6644/g.11735 Transcript_6644/m.11735 type:complete len:116 (-) Transcript_6644:2008-2355(-)
MVARRLVCGLFGGHVLRQSRRLTTGRGKSVSGEQKVPDVMNKYAQKPVQTGTTFFNIANPELLVDPKKASSWYLVAVVWIGFGSYIAYLNYNDKVQAERRDKALVGPRRKDGTYE